MPNFEISSKFSEHPNAFIAFDDFNNDDSFRCDKLSSRRLTSSTMSEEAECETFSGVVIRSVTPEQII